MYKIFRPLLFKLDPETAHALTLQLIRLGAYQPFNLLLRTMNATPRKPVEAFGLTFRNPLGLAAGYDKDGLAWRGLATLGFGHIEVGTVTPLPQEGNPRPRLFRLEQDRALINRMGFPGRGSASVRRQLRGKRPRGLVLGVNLGKNKQVPNEQAVFDYLSLLENFAPLVDYLAINVSSPNTEGLRRLQAREALEGLLTQLAYQRRIEQGKLEKRIPLLVKLAPDLSEVELDDALEAILRTGMDGVIATNTTLARDGLRSARAGEQGGLSGEPLRAGSVAVLRQIVKRVGGRLPVVSTGGIMSPADAKARLEEGAALVQVYTGLVYAGPGLVRKIIRAV